jgi:hypothetical protein
MQVYQKHLSALFHFIGMIRQSERVLFALCGSKF